MAAKRKKPASSRAPHAADAHAAQVYHADLWGLRDTTYNWLADHALHAAR